jgi:NAD(P)-dependent dehydrogenase (short-subunit alcohol dehydrogenase family)
MPDSNRAALVTGASRGIGRALAETLGQEGFDLTITAKHLDPLVEVADKLIAEGVSVEHIEADVVSDGAIREVVRHHQRRYGRLDVLVNSAGVCIGANVGEDETDLIDLQLDVNVRSVILFYRECVALLRQTAAQHQQSLVVNLASLVGKSPQPWVSVYSATKAAVLAYTTAMNRELGRDGVTSVALCPGLVDTDMTDYTKDSIPAEEMLSTSDIADGLRFLLRMSPDCLVPEIVFVRSRRAR